MPLVLHQRGKIAFQKLIYASEVKFSTMGYQEMGHSEELGRVLGLPLLGNFQRSRQHRRGKLSLGNEKVQSSGLTPHTHVRPGVPLCHGHARPRGDHHPPWGFPRD